MQFPTINYKEKADSLKNAIYHAKAVKTLENFIHEIQKERALTLSDEREKLIEQRKNTDNAVRNLTGYADYEKFLKSLREKADSKDYLQAVSNSYKELLSLLTNDMLSRASYIGHEMELIRTHTRLVQIKDSLSEIECVVLPVLDKNFLDRDSFFSIIAAKGEFEHNQKQFFQIAREDFKTLYIQRFLLNPKKDILDRMLNKIINNQIKFSSTEWLETVSSLIDVQKEIQTALTQRIIFSIERQHANFMRKFYFLVLITLFLASSAIFIPLYLSRKMIFSIKVLQDGLNKFLCFLEGKTDEYRMIPVYSKDEIGKTSELCNKSFLEIESLFEKLNTYNEKIEAILDAQESIVAIGKPVEGVAYLNKKFFEIFPYKNINDFTSKHKYISELFIEKEGYLKKGTEEHHWTEQVLNEPDKIHLAVMIDKFGQERIFSVNVRKVELPNERFLIKIFTDVTELEIQRKKAQEAEKAKTEFLSRMSHEIRTPLTGIVGFLGLLSKTKLDDTQLRYISVMQNSIETLMNIVNDILDMAKIEAGKMEIEYFNVNPFVELDKAITLFAPKARQKGLKYLYSIDPKIHECLTMPKEAIKQVLSNLINNAIKFTEAGEININVSVIEDFEDEQIVRFEVKDTGIGIPEDKQSVIFEKFAQADTSIRYAYGGTGLGLSISSSLVKMMGGTLELKSKSGEGSSFYFTIPLKKCVPEQSLYKMFDKFKICIFKTSDERSEKVALMLGSWHIAYYHIELSKAEGSFDIGIFFDKKDLEESLERCSRLIFVSDKEYIEHEKVITIKGTPSQLYIAIMQTISFLSPKKEEALQIKIPLKVLVGEDNEVNRMFFEELLKKYGIEVDFALNGAEAVNRVKDKKYDLVFMDISMPVMDGVEATKIIKKDYPELPVVALTAHVLKGERENLLAAGFDDYLPKPVPIAEFERIVKKYAKTIYTEKVSEVEKTELDSFIEKAKEELGLPDETLHNLYKKFFETLNKKVDEIAGSFREE